MIAPADPITLAAAFSDQAQRTEACWRRSSRIRPVGKGMPMQNPAGAMSMTVIAIFIDSGQPTPPARSGDTTAAIVATRTITAAIAIDSFVSDSPISLAPEASHAARE